VFLSYCPQIMLPCTVSLVAVPHSLRAQALTALTPLSTPSRAPRPIALSPATPSRPRGRTAPHSTHCTRLSAPGLTAVKTSPQSDAALGTSLVLSCAPLMAPSRRGLPRRLLPHPPGSTATWPAARLRCGMHTGAPSPAWPAPLAGYRLARGPP
jgi:hypothetical protein